jgi:2,5-diketo-D-gluconate reductase B
MDMIETDGMRMPKLGLGTYRVQGDACRAAVESALSLGYRHIDTAEMYANEDAVGAALGVAGLPRDTLHVTTKVWWQNLEPAAMRAAAERSLAALRLEYVDLYLIHWPAPEMNLPQAIEALVGIRQAGLARHIGVSNFPSAMLRDAVGVAARAGATLVCDQVEYHVLLAQPAVLRATREAGAVLTAYAPLAQGRLAEHPSLDAIAKKHGATPAQVALKWLLDQDGVAAIPKAARPESQAANLGALKITLDDSDRAAIAALPKDQRFVKPGFAPTWDKPAV